MSAIQMRETTNKASRKGRVPSVLVMHADQAARLAQSLVWIMDPDSDVSYHDLIGRTGILYSCVPDDMTAWACGDSRFPDATYSYASKAKKAIRTSINATSISVCLSNRHDGKEKFTDVQYEVGAARAAHYMRKYPRITLDRITTHEVVATPAGRKTDPGPLFDMELFRRLVAAHLTEPEGTLVSVADFGDVRGGSSTMARAA